MWLQVPIHHSVFEQVWTLCVTVILVAWFAASALHQFRFEWWTRLARFDPLHLLPRWSFFAPNPGRYDVHVVYRTWTATAPGSWREITTTRLSKWQWCWNPTRYTNKGICDLVNSLYGTIQSGKNAPRSVILSGPYISLLSLVMAQRVDDRATTHRQFAIVATQHFAEQRQLEVKYISEVHRVNP